MGKWVEENHAELVSEFVDNSYKVKKVRGSNEMKPQPDTRTSKVWFYEKFKDEIEIQNAPKKKAKEQTNEEFLDELLKRANERASAK